jgi:hypothetical protein
MAFIIFRCPYTGLYVQHELDNAASHDEKPHYDAVTCPACARLHFVNRSTGKTLGHEQD